MVTRPQSVAELSRGQHQVLTEFTSGSSRRSLVFAKVGTGKTTVGSLAARWWLLKDRGHQVLLVADQDIVRQHWRDRMGPGHPSGTVRSVHLDDFNTKMEHLVESATGAPCLIVVEDLHRFSASKRLWDGVERILAANHDSRCLVLTSSLDAMLESGFSWDAEYILDPPPLVDKNFRQEILRYSPSHALLKRLSLEEPFALDDLTWRQFETLVSRLLEAEGYSVELMQGTKDGGVDVVALFDQGPLGQFKTVWQAKKLRAGKKVELSTVRELADTRIQFGASKAYIVTSTYLTRGAIEKISRDRFTLGKVERNELDLWVRRVLLQKHGPTAGR
jgi:restriction system protein